MATPLPQEYLHLKDGAGDYLHVAWLLVVRPYTTVTCEMHLSKMVQCIENITLPENRYSCRRLKVTER